MRSLAPPGVVALMLLLALGASGCVSLAEGTAQAPGYVTPTPEATEETPAPTSSQPTLAPTPTVNPDLQRIFTTYQHETNVFSVSIPESWTARDDSSDERLLVALEPPLGFASRILVDITYESDLTLNELAALRDGYLELFYGSDDNYTEINRTELPDGRLQVTLLYNNPAGASGRETVYLSQDGPYFSALRIFAADNDGMLLTGVVDQIVESYTVNPTARWGEPELEVDPEALQVQGLYGWTDGEGNYRVTGRIFNAWQDDVGLLAVSAGVCDPNGVVLSENSALLINDLLPVGSVVPFEVQFSAIDHPEPRPCLVQPRAEPASRIPVETYDALEMTQDVSYEAEEEDEEPILTVSGTVFNAGTSTVHLIDIVVAVYDGAFDSPDSHVIGYAITTTEAAELAPGEASLFSASFEPGQLGGPPVDVELWRQANALQLTPTP